MYPIAVSTALLSWGLLEFPKVSGGLLHDSAFAGQPRYPSHFCMVVDWYVCQNEVSNAWL